MNEAEAYEGDSKSRQRDSYEGAATSLLREYETHYSASYGGRLFVLVQDEAGLRMLLRMLR